MKTKARVTSGIACSRRGRAVNLRTLLHELGYEHLKAEEAALGALQEAKLARKGKVGILSTKIGAVVDVLESRFQLLCDHPDCQWVGCGEPSRKILPVSRAKFCRVCADSNSRRSVGRMVLILRKFDLSRLLVVGGSPSTQRELRELVSDCLRIKFVDGTASRNGKRAAHDIAWADVVAIWVTAEIAHKVSKLYTGAKVRGGHPVIVRQRGVSSLARDIAQRFAG